jgi:hypothetical protein
LSFASVAERACRKVTFQKTASSAGVKIGSYFRSAKVLGSRNSLLSQLKKLW